MRRQCVESHRERPRIHRPDFFKRLRMPVHTQTSEPPSKNDDAFLSVAESLYLMSADDFDDGPS